MKRLLATSLLIAGLMSLPAGPASVAWAGDDGDVGRAVAAGILAGLVVSGSVVSPAHTVRHHDFAYVDRHGRRVHRDHRGHHFFLEDSGRRVRVLPHTDARFAYWDGHHSRDVWRSCRRGEHRTICSHFYLDHHGERIYLD